MVFEEVGKRARALREASGIDLNFDLGAYIDHQISSKFRPELHKMINFLVKEEIGSLTNDAKDAQTQIRLTLEPFSKAEEAVFGRVRHVHYKSRSIIAYVTAVVWALFVIGAFFMQDPDGSYPFRGVLGVALAAFGVVLVTLIAALGRRNNGKSSDLKTYLATQDAGFGARIKQAERDLTDSINTMQHFARSVDTAIVIASENPVVIDTYNKLRRQDELNRIDDLQNEHDRAEGKAADAFLRATARREKGQSTNSYEIGIRTARIHHEIYLAEAQSKRREVDRAKREIN